MSDWYISSKMRPNYRGGLIENRDVQGGLFIVKTVTARNNIGLLDRLKDVDTTTLCYVITNKEFYELINEPGTATTQESDWDLLDFGGGSEVKPIGEWDAAANEVVETGDPLLDTDAVDINGNFYSIVNADAGLEIQYDGLFRSQTITVYTGDQVMSVGLYFAVIRPRTTWATIPDIPTVIDEYVAGEVQSHEHAISNIVGLQSALDDKFDSDDVADHTIDFGSVPDSDLVSKIFTATHFYTKNNVYTQTQVNDAIAAGLSTYAFPGNVGEVILSDGAGDAEAYAGFLYDSIKNTIYVGSHTKTVLPQNAVVMGDTHVFNAGSNFNYGAVFGQSNAFSGASPHGLVAGSGHAITAADYAYVFGEAITVDTGHTMYAPLLRIGQGTGATLTQDDSATQIAVIDVTTGEIKYRASSTIVAHSFRTWHYAAVDSGYTWAGNDVIAEDHDTMDIVAGANITIETDETLKAIKITASASASSPLTTKGDLYTYSTGDTRLAVGANGYVLVADNTRGTGLRWGVVGDVLKTGSPADNYVAIWTSSTNIEGTNALKLINISELLVNGNGTNSVIHAYSSGSGDKSYFLAQASHASGGDAYIEFAEENHTYSFGIDVTDSNKIKLTYASSGAVDPSSGTTFLDVSTLGTFTFNSKFYIGDGFANFTESRNDSTAILTLANTHPSAGKVLEIICTHNGANPSFQVYGNATRLDMSITGSGEVKIVNATGKLGVFGATPISKPSITGSRGGNVALADFLTKMASLGLITDATS